MKSLPSSRPSLKILSFALLTSPLMTACGGGGGGSTTEYTGTWNLNAAKVVDSCGRGVPQTISADLVVSQSGSSVVVQVGSLVLTGELNDKDGFNALLTRPGTNGCTQGVSVVFNNASDGSADVGYAIAAQCGRVTCAVGYGGIATRGARKDSPLERAENGTDIAPLLDGINDSAEKTDQGIEGGLLNALEETQLELLGDS